MKVRYRFKREQRLVRTADYRLVFNNNRSVVGRYWQVLVVKNSYKYGRLGLVISKRVLKKAVHRNLYKRIAREVFRLNQYNLTGLDFVVMARKNYGNKTTKKMLRQELLTLLQSYDKSN